MSPFRGFGLPRPAQKDLFTKRFRLLKTHQREDTSLHIPLVKVLRLTVRPDVLWWHTPNGEYRDKRTAAKLKAMAVLPGVPDLTFMWSSDAADAVLDQLMIEDTYGLLRVLFLELKLPGQTLLESQLDFKVKAKAHGASFEIARTVEEALEVLKRYDLLRPGVRIEVGK